MLLIIIYLIDCFIIIHQHTCILPRYQAQCFLQVFLHVWQRKTRTPQPLDACVKVIWDLQTPVILFSRLNAMFLGCFYLKICFLLMKTNIFRGGYFYLKICFLLMKTNIFRGELTNISDEIQTLKNTLPCPWLSPSPASVVSTYIGGLLSQRTTIWP